MGTPLRVMFFLGFVLVAPHRPSLFLTVASVTEPLCRSRTVGRSTFGCILLYFHHRRAS
jgi:hypothetical protein